MKVALLFTSLFIALNCFAAPATYKELLPFVQAAPDQGETNTCWFVASTGAMELLLNKKHNIQNPKPGSKFDLAESFVIWQRNHVERGNPWEHFIEEVVRRFNHGEAVHISHWPFKAYKEDGTDNMDVWRKHPDFYNLPRLEVPRIKTELLFAKGRKYAMHVLRPSDIDLMKETLSTRRSPLIVNYNDDSYWHVVLIVGYDDNAKGKCYEVENDECNEKGAFYVRDSFGERYDTRAYSWFLVNGNAAAVVELE